MRVMHQIKYRQLHFLVQQPPSFASHRTSGECITQSPELGKKTSLLRDVHAIGTFPSRKPGEVGGEEPFTIVFENPRILRNPETTAEIVKAERTKNKVF
jgi:hypothetical protein